MRRPSSFVSSILRVDCNRCFSASISISMLPLHAHLEEHVFFFFACGRGHFFQLHERLEFGFALLFFAFSGRLVLFFPSCVARRLAGKGSGVT